MPTEALTIGLVYLATAAACALLAVRWRRRAPALSAAVVVSALLAFAIPGALTLLMPPVAGTTSSGESQPYVMLVWLWLFMLVPTGAGLTLAAVYVRSRPPIPGS